MLLGVGTVQGSRGVFRLGKRFVKLLLGGVVSRISKLNMKYSKSCLILDVVVQTEKGHFNCISFFYSASFLQESSAGWQTSHLQNSQEMQGHTFLGDLYR